MPASKQTYHYFLISSSRPKRRREVAKMIRDNQDLSILKILDHQPKNLTRFIKTAYPAVHLGAKNFKPKKQEVRFIFVQSKKGNKPVNDVYQQITSQKTQEEPIYLSDHEPQVDRTLKYLGLKKGTGHFKNIPHLSLSLPHYLSRFNKFTTQNVRPSQLVCHILKGNKKFFWMKTVPIEKTPHFAYLTGNARVYQEYLDRFLGGPLASDYSLENFMNLTQKLTYLKPPYTNTYILVQELWPGKYLILDGVHRASILRFKGLKRFPVAVKKRTII